MRDDRACADQLLRIGHSSTTMFCTCSHGIDPELYPECYCGADDDVDDAVSEFVSELDDEQREALSASDTAVEFETRLAAIAHARAVARIEPIAAPAVNTARMATVTSQTTAIFEGQRVLLRTDGRVLEIGSAIPARFVRSGGIRAIQIG